MGEYATRFPIIDSLKNRGWHLTAEKASWFSPLTRVQPGSELNCGDGRNPICGPTLFGGLWALMALNTGGDISGYREAQRRILQAGFMPGIHGDSKNPFNCGFFELWRQGQLQGVNPFELGTGEEYNVVSTVNQLQVPGIHCEKMLIVNFVNDHTLKPNPQYFRVDAWLADSLGINMSQLLDVSTQTVELLSNVRQMKIIIP